MVDFIDMVLRDNLVPNQTLSRRVRYYWANVYSDGILGYNYKQPINQLFHSMKDAYTALYGLYVPFKYWLRHELKKFQENGIDLDVWEKMVKTIEIERPNMTIPYLEACVRKENYFVLDGKKVQNLIELFEV